MKLYPNDKPLDKRKFITQDIDEELDNDISQEQIDNLVNFVFLDLIDTQSQSLKQTKSNNNQ